MSRLPLVLALLLPAVLRADDLAQRAHAILQENCFACHGSALQMSRLDLRTRASILNGGERGEAVIPNYPERSRIYLYAAHEQNPTMPPGKKLPDDDVETLRRWILAGAAMPTVDAEEQDRQAALAELEERPVTDEERQYWAFQQPAKPDPPSVKNAKRVRNPIDAFLLAEMEAQGIQPSPPAGRRTLIRRACLDLTGLPPSPEEVEAFVRDESPEAFERLVDGLLASPHYGERWGRHWLDLVRYADSGGFERDFDWPQAWRFRDYVIEAFNRDKPYDEFIREQIAGDEIAPDSTEARIATGYLRLGPDNNIKNERTRMDELDDILATTAQTFLGLTLQCARCHNHKFDPIPQKDYYRMQAVFFSTKHVDCPLVSEEVVGRHKAEQKRIDEQQAPLEEAKQALEKPYRDRLFEAKVAELPKHLRIAWRTPPEKRTEGQRLNARQIDKTLKIDQEDILEAMTASDRNQHSKLAEQIKDLERQRPEPYATAMTIGEEGREALPSYFLHRGNPDSKGSVMSPGVLTVASRGEVRFKEPPKDASSSWRRRRFAEWIASPGNPLTARVMVNRIWQHHFGEGIVRTASNFGATGERPTHPELLDWLAVEFVERGWSIKAMHRLMMTSRAYRMGSDDDPAKAKIDPENRLVWRMPRQRVEAEAMRDSILAVAGTLDRTVGGPAVFPYISPDLFQSSTGRTWPGRADRDPATWRRSVYVFSKRSIRYPLFETFDQPDMIHSCDRRNRSTTAPQALLLMNNQAVLLQAKFFAQRLREEAGRDAGAQAERAFQLALARLPTREERRDAVEFIESDPYGLVDFCQALFNLNEFVYRQ